MHAAALQSLLFEHVSANTIFCRIHNSATSGVSYSFFLSHASKICIIVCMVVGKMRILLAPSEIIKCRCTEA